MNKRAVGTKYEEMAAKYLTLQGLSVIEMNYRVRSGEIDIVARDNNFIVFVEVKYRRTASAGHPEEAVDYKKIKNICRTADHYRIYHKLNDEQYYRFDVVAIEDDSIRWYKNAYDYIK